MNVWTPIDAETNVWSDAEAIAAVSFIALEDGGVVLLENGDSVLTEVQPHSGVEVWTPFPRYVALMAEDGRILLDDAGNMILTSKALTAWKPIGD